MSVINFQSGNYTGTVQVDPNNWVFTVEGVAKGCKSLEFLAPTTPDLRQSYSGSGLPFATELIAFENTKNHGKLVLNADGRFKFQLLRPNAYYINNGSTLIKPHVKMILDDKDIFEVNLGEPIPYRSLKNLPGRPRRTEGR